MPIRQAIIPAAGLGTRFLPVTKAVPKELLPLLDKPCIQHVIDEAVQAGVEEFVIVISPEKQAMVSYFKKHDYLNEWLSRRDKTDVLDELSAVESKATFHFVTQDEPLGLGHAVLCARDHIGNEPFFVILPDDIIDAEVPVCRQMVAVFEANKLPLISVMQVPWEEVHRYGIVKADPILKDLGNIQGIVEKPERKDAPSNLAVIGRYLLPKEIFALLEKTTPGAGGEIQLTDALKGLIAETGLNSFLFKGRRFDTGTPAGLLQASISLSVKHPAFREKMIPFLKNLGASL